MRNRTLLIACVLLLGLPLLMGCGALRSLTTKHFDFRYTVLSGTLNFPGATPADSLPKFSVAITDDLASKDDRYHGGIDWAGLEYTAINGSASASREVRMYASTLGNLTASELSDPSKATLVESLTLAPGETKVVDQLEPGNVPLANFLAYMLGQTSDRTVYLYFKLTSDDPAVTLRISNLLIKGRAHGSLF